MPDWIMLGSILKPSVLPTLGLSITKMQRYKKNQNAGSDHAGLGIYIPIPSILGSQWQEMSVATRGECAH